MKCTNCGTQNTDDARHCRRCGAVLPTSSEVTQPTPVAANDAGGTRPPGSDQRTGLGNTRPLVDDTIPPVNHTAEPQSNAAATRPLPRNRLFFEALPEGAILSDGHYRVCYLIEESPLLNSYSAVSRQALIECRSCGFAHNHYGDQFCKQCGASLSDLEPHYPNFILKESAAADAIATERRLAEMNLHHGGALLPVETFSEVIFGTRRFYVILPEPSPFTGINLPEQPETTDVVNWGMQLADALAYLHKNNITLGAATLEHISISGKAARWFNFAEARLQPANARNRKPFADDIVSLTTNLFVLLTGKTYSPSVEVSPPGLAGTFQAVFAGKITTAAQLADRLRDVIAEIRRPTSYDLRVGRLSDVGQVRQINEDSLLTLEAGVVHRSIGSPLGLYVVADGMGGHSAGDVASGLAIDAVARHALQTLLPQTIGQKSPRVNIDDWLRETIGLANATVHEQRRAANTNMGTTFVLAVVAEGEARIAHVGDSRAYLVNAAGIKQITVDHSLVQRLIETKQLTPEEARTHPQRNVIYKNLGDRPQVEPDINHLSLEPGDFLLLCTDGLSGYVDDADIHQIVMAASSPQDACHKLIDAANANGGPDNITAIVVQMESLG